MNHTIPIPDRLKKFPLWRGKYPIFYVVTVHNGEPLFTVLSRAKQVEATNKNLCHICGERMSPPYYFIGGPMCMKYRRFNDGPMHKECAEYAAKACPFLANPLAKYKANPPVSHQNEVFKAFAKDAKGEMRPAKMCVAATMKYEGFVKGRQYPEFVAGEWVEMDWNIIPQREEMSHADDT